MHPGVPVPRDTPEKPLPPAQEGKGRLPLHGRSREGVGSTSCHSHVAVYHGNRTGNGERTH